MRDDPEYWDALTARIVDEVHGSRRASWLGVAVWTPPLAAAVVLMALIANVGRGPAGDGTPSIADMLASRGQAPSIVTMMREQR